MKEANAQPAYATSFLLQCEDLCERGERIVCVAEQILLVIFSAPVSYEGTHDCVKRRLEAYKATVLCLQGDSYG